MGIHLWAFLGVAGLLIVAPGSDTALVTKNALVHGRRAALGTSVGISAGLFVWTVAAALGIAALVRESAVAFDALRAVGAVYLIWLGLQALSVARRPGADTALTGPHTAADGLRVGVRQGVINNLANPKIAVFLTGILPQFVSPGRQGAPWPFLSLGCAYVLMSLLWLSGYAQLAVKLSGTLRRPRIKAALDRVTGVVLVGLRLHLALEHR